MKILEDETLTSFFLSFFVQYLDSDGSGTSTTCTTDSLYSSDSQLLSEDPLKSFDLHPRRFLQMSRSFVLLPFPLPSFPTSAHSAFPSLIQFTQLSTWLASVGRQAIVSETGAGNNAGCITLFGNELKYIAANPSTIAGFTVWSVSGLAGIQTRIRIRL